MLPFDKKYTTEYISMAHSLGINNFEISADYYYCSKNIICRNEIYSIHAPKNLLFEPNLEQLRNRVIQIKNFCECVDCHRLVFHPNIDTNKNSVCFEVLSELLEGYVVCMENVNNDLEGLMPLLMKHHYKIVWDVSHAMFHAHEIEKKIEAIEHFHVRGFSPKSKYVTLCDSPKKIVIPRIESAVYFLEYPYRNMFELLKDWKYINSFVFDGLS